MAGHRRSSRSGDDDWIFAADPGTASTEKLPSREEVELLAAEREERPRHRRPVRDQRDQRDLRNTRTGALPALDEDGEEIGADWDREGDDAGEIAPHGEDAPAPVHGSPSYARSGTTPNAQDAPGRGASIPARFADLGAFDALRDVTAFVCLVAAMSTTYTHAGFVPLDVIGRIGVGLALLVLVVVHVLRWLPATPHLQLVRTVRVAGLAPVLVIAVGTVVTDLVLSLPVLFAPLPEGPPVGLGAGVCLLLAGVIVGIEPRAHEGYLPSALARRRSRTVLAVIALLAALAFAFSLVMLVGRVFTTGWAYSLLTFASALVSALVLVLLIGAALRRDRSWFVFTAAAASGLVVLAIADASLRLEFAAPTSFATDFVYLPFVFAAWGVMVSRSFVRTMPLSFHRVDWILYAVRAFEFSVVVHVAAMVWNLLAAVAAIGGAGLGGPVIHVMDLVVSACFVAISLFARRCLLERPADVARSSAVIAGVVMLVVGFLDVIVNSLATGAGAGLMTGGVALAIGVAAALMLTVPAPVRDDYGAPDLGRMFADFRTRNTPGTSASPELIPDVSEERARIKVFPG
ncbi:hypothetical protein DEO23_02585 [Brachybacterium endophyticum]|uniref:DUF7937 domain-containing protein n=1 Tax=Brachybacterium endophyticum TaxID=2182385 RepID=A0A2U2RP46_9MICO|nr:hypothetical protein [Brachybacterium endophyticum]PWH07534.1 hypothetical protein DEO23_02585 [Brachybacterium endophyticum]